MTDSTASGELHAIFDGLKAYVLNDSFYPSNAKRDIAKAKACTLRWHHQQTRALQAKVDAQEQYTQQAIIVAQIALLERLRGQAESWQVGGETYYGDLPLLVIDQELAKLKEVENE